MSSPRFPPSDNSINCLLRLLCRRGVEVPKTTLRIATSIKTTRVIRTAAATTTTFLWKIPVRFPLLKIRHTKSESFKIYTLSPSSKRLVRDHCSWLTFCTGPAKRARPATLSASASFNPRMSAVTGAFAVITTAHSS